MQTLSKAKLEAHIPSEVGFLYSIDESKSKANSVSELEDNKEQFDAGIDFPNYSAVDMMLNENENQSETEITDNLDDFVDDVEKHLLILFVPILGYYCHHQRFCSQIPDHLPVLNLSLISPVRLYLFYH